MGNAMPLVGMYGRGMGPRLREDKRGGVGASAEMVGFEGMAEGREFVNGNEIPRLRYAALGMTLGGNGGRAPTRDAPTGAGEDL